MPDLASLESIAAARARVSALSDLLGADELAVLVRVAEGLARGRGVYGELVLAGDRRDFTEETREELADAMAYAGAALVRLERAGGVRR